MASNEPSRRASVASSSDMSLVDPTVAGKVLPKKDKPSGPIKLKKSIAQNSKPKDTAGTPSPTPNSPSINGNDPEPLAPASLSGDDRVRCKHCRKPVLTSLMVSHVKTCPEKKKKKDNNKDKLPKKKDSKDVLPKSMTSNEDKDGEIPDDDSVAGKVNGTETTADAEGLSSVKGLTKSAKKTAAKEATTSTNDNSSKKTKKRKADVEGDKEPKKKKLKKDEPPKPKMPKPKGPVDVEKQCGVLLPNGGYCARSLTCKSHSMGAKRGVPGRSMPYDFLLAQYQKKNQAKQQSKSPKLVPEHSKDPECVQPHSSPIYLGLTNLSFVITEAAMDANAPLVDDTDANVPVDSDEEKDAFMAGLARWRPQPLAQHVFVGRRTKYNRIRVKEALAQALAGQRGSNMFAVRPPDVASSQTAARTGSNTEAADFSAMPLDLSTGAGNAVPTGATQSEDGATAGTGALDHRPSLIQQALGGDANNNTAAGGSSSSGAAVPLGGQARKASVAAAAP
ncbi:MAG: hypothetical protein Q9186_005147 [Xanthomendoza sp. 1 TL-2023]